MLAPSTESPSQEGSEVTENIFGFCSWLENKVISGLVLVSPHSLKGPNLQAMPMTVS